MDDYADTWKVTRPRDGRIDHLFVEAALKAGRTSNGVFGGRIMAETFPEVVDSLACAAPESTPTDVDLLEAAFGDIKFVHLRRDDVVAQAVSWAKSLQTHFWHPGEEIEPGGQAPYYDQELISRLADTIVRSEAAWKIWFATHGIQPHEVTYEQLATDPPGTAQRVLDHLGLKVPPDRPLVVGHHRQADRTNTRWIKKFKSS